MKSVTSKILTIGVFVASVTIFAGCGGDDHFHGGGNNGGNNGGGTGTAPYTYLSPIGSSATLADPDAITPYSGGSYYIASYGGTGIGTPKVTAFDKHGNKVRDIGVTGTTATGLLAGPQGVATDASGNLYVADGPNYRVVKYNPSGNFVAVLLQNQCGFPYQINADSAGNLYVACSTTNTAGVSNQASVVKFSPTGTVLLVVGNSGIAGQTLQDADGVTLDGANNILVTDYQSGAVFAFSPTGTYLGTFGNTGNFALEGPQGIYFDNKSGDIFVADLVGNDVAIYDSSGNLLGSVNSGTNGTVLNDPYDVRLDSSGNLLVVDEMDNRVAVFAPVASLKAQSLAKPVRTIGHKSTQPHH